MSTLTTPGLYHVLGKKFEAIILVTGAAPTLRVVSGVNLTATMLRGKFVPIEESSIEIQAIIATPNDFVFTKKQIVEDYLYESAESAKGVSLPKLTDVEFKSLCDRYTIERNIEGRGANAVKFYIMERFGYNEPQAQLIILKIAKALKKRITK